MHHAIWLKATCIVCTALSLGAAMSFALPQHSPSDTGTAAVGPAREGVAPPLVNADSLAHVIAVHNPFRSSRAPASARFNPDASALGAPPPPAPQRPTLTLAGIMMGSDPTALIDGIPGTEGTRVLRAGERVGDFVVRQIAPDRVVIASKDSTWTLRVRTRFQ